MKRTILLLLICFIVLLPVSAEVVSTTAFGADAAYYTADNKGYESDGFAPISYTPAEAPDDYTYVAGDEGRTLGSTWGGAEAKVYLSHTIQMPFLVGDNFLTSGNNLNLRVKGNLSPVTLDLECRALLTPIAVLQFELGGMVGSGWSALGFNGMGLTDTTSGEIAEDAFAGVVTKGWLSGTFQFDLAAVMPGDWNHVVMIANGKVQYQNYSAAGEMDPWQWQADAGENYNGFEFMGTYFLGYQMPLKLNTVGLLFETEEYIGAVRDYSTMASDGWGSDFVNMKLAAMGSMSLTDTQSLTILFQLQKDQDYTDDTIFSNSFLNRDYEDDMWRFYRVAFSYGLKL